MSEKKRRFSRGSLETTTSERLEAIVEAAEQAAAQVIDDAERQALRYLADARAEAETAYDQRITSLAAATDSLMAQAEEIRRRSDRLLEALEDVRAALEGEGGDRRSGGDRRAPSRRAARTPAPAPAPSPDPAPAPELAPDRRFPRGSHLSAVEPAEQPQPSFSQPHPVRESPAGARLLATQMAVSGSSREEIAARLRTGFEIENTDSILDAILGPEE